jgi:hypothetical protein
VHIVLGKLGLMDGEDILARVIYGQSKVDQSFIVDLLLSVDLPEIKCDRVDHLGASIIVSNNMLVLLTSLIEVPLLSEALPQ